MTDYYKKSLEILAQILKAEKYDHWANWMLEDVKLWEANKSVEHHLHAYGGMGSFNDIAVGGNDQEGIWKNRLFGSLQTLAYSLAKGNALENVLETISNRALTGEISGWRCRNCGDARINDRNIDIYMADEFIPKFFVEYIREDRIDEIVNIPKLINSEELMKKRVSLQTWIKEAGIILNSDTDWLWTCPKCVSMEVCSYRWNVLKDESKLVEGNDNLEMNKD